VVDAEEMLLLLPLNGQTRATDFSVTRV
jgi:hypothetical protein